MSETNGTTADVEEGVPAANGSNSFSSRPRALSKVSQLYDIDGDGKLDAAEQKMRDMDPEGKGFLSNAKVYSIFQEQLQMQQQLMMAKRIIIFFAAFLVLLAVANIGVAFAAASLAKDTSTENNVLLVKETGEVVATDTYTHAFDLGLPEETQRRLLEEPNTFFSDSICSPCTIGVNNETSLEIRRLCLLGLPVTVRLFYLIPGSANPDGMITKEHLTSYTVCNWGNTEDIVTEGEGEIRDGTPEIVTKFTITDSPQVAVGADGGRRGLNAVTDPEYVFEGGLSGPWLFSTQNIPSIPSATTTAAAAATTAAP